MTTRLEHYVCFDCRKQFKQRATSKHPVCPQCAKKMTWMGRNFRAPKMKDKKAWAKVKADRAKGITHDTCPCCLKDKRKKKLGEEIRNLVKNVFKRK